MKAWTALLCLCPLAYGAAPTHIQTCTTAATAATATGANQLVGCPTKSVVWGPLYTTDLVRAILPSGAQGWIPYTTLTPSTQVVPQSTGGWTAFGKLTVIAPAPPPIPPVVPVQTLHAYVVVWDAVTLRVDGTPLTDLTGYLAQTGPSVAGPWGSALTVKGTTASFTLPATVKQCFSVSAISQSAGTGDPAILCVPPVIVGLDKPAAPTNAAAD